MTPRLGHVGGGRDAWVIYDADLPPGYASAHVTGNWIESRYDGPGGTDWARGACKRYGIDAPLTTRMER